jgi:hypothetical protein
MADEAQQQLPPGYLPVETIARFIATSPPRCDGPAGLPQSRGGARAAGRRPEQGSPCPLQACGACPAAQRLNGRPCGSDCSAGQRSCWAHLLKGKGPIALLPHRSRAAGTRCWTR